ncbi:MAG: flippase-like domain-containing protein [candidate division Zixibacteria bacterium]|nr:flippase-like domain-containing protein [candidate division Zixibacteria bacterium]
MRNLLDWRRIAGILVAAGLLVLTFHNVNLGELWRDLKSIRPLYLVTAFVSAVGMNWAKGMRWREIILPIRPITQTRAFSLFHVGQMINLSLPVLTGQAGRIVMLAKQENLSKTFCLTTIALEVLFDGISLVILMYLTSFVFPFSEDFRFKQICVAVVLGVVILIIVTILRNQRALEYFGKKRLRRRFPRLYGSLRKWAKSVADGLEALNSWTQIVKIGFYSVLVWIFHIGAAVSLIMAFEFAVDDWAKMVEIGLVVIVVNSIMLLVPISPGNIGSFQFVVKGTLVELFKVSSAKATAFSLLMHFMDVVPVFIIGILFLFTNQFAFRKLREEAVAKVRESDESESVENKN